MDDIITSKLLPSCTTLIRHTARIKFTAKAPSRGKASMDDIITSRLLPSCTTLKRHTARIKIHSQGAQPG